MILSFRFAFRYLVSPKSGSFSSFASWLSIAGLGIGISALLLTASIINGFEKTIAKKIISFDGDARLKHILGKHLSLEDKKLKIILADLSKNYNIYPFIRGITMIRSGIEADGIIIEGIPIIAPSIKVIWSIEKEDRKLNSGEIVIGKQLAKLLNVELGNKVFLDNFNEQSGRRIFPLKIVGLYESGLSEYEKTLAYLSVEDAQSALGLDKKHVSGWIVFNNSESKLELSEVFYPLILETWMERHSLLIDWINFQRYPAFIMFGLITVVGIVNIFAGLSMIIIEKKTQIAILMAQGYSDSDIENIFIIQGGFIGILASLFGGLLSILIIFLQMKYEILTIPKDIYFMDKIPMIFDGFVFTSIVFLSFLFCMVASWWPSKMIAKLSPSFLLLSK
tara:strand:- start:70752 stop:71930 length:1179 start_codon:yes stop_codon:yes gene_type:complete